MGYRSDVHAVFYTTRKEELPLLKLYVDENFPDELCCHLVAIDSNRIYGYEMICENAKWYESYPDVKAFNAFKDKYLALLDEPSTGKKWHYEFVQLGEETEDIECERSAMAENVLSVSRRIEADY
jgi:hypothetical protein